MQNVGAKPCAIAQQTRRVGQTDIKVGRISLGCSAIANMYVDVSEEAAAALLDHAWARGIRYFDTASYYGRGR